MDLNAQCCSDPARVDFRFAEGGQLHAASVSLFALAALSNVVICSEDGAIAAYQAKWREVHAVALSLRAAGHQHPFIQREDVV